MDWTFLDRVDKNLLYVYARSLSKRNSKANYQTLYKIGEDCCNDEVDFKCAEKRREIAFYAVWFVYRYVLACETLEQALRFANEETLIEYKLSPFFSKRHIYIGAYGLKEVYLYYEEDIKIVLEILYNRYDFWEQLSCFVKHTKDTKRTTHKRCLQNIKEYEEMINNNNRYKKMARGKKK